MIVVIISGGSGARLWPVSRNCDPKPFMKLYGGKSLLAQTFERSFVLNDVTRIVVVTNEKLHARTHTEYQDIQKEFGSTIPCDFILEPCARNTAAAVLAATLFIQNHYGNEVILVLPADHTITNTNRFKDAVNSASAIALKEYIVTFGITPHYPETGYGYIKSDTHDPILSGYKVASFVEKPDLELAKHYVSSGEYSWNSGMFCATANTFVQEFRAHANSLTNQVILALGTHNNTNTIIKLNKDAFVAAENISIDYAVLEKSAKTAVVQCDIGWSDIGSWLTIADTLKQDLSTHNTIIGDAVVVNETNNCLIYNANKNQTIALSDVNSLAIVNTEDALLIVDKNHTQNVKVLVGKLKDLNPEILEHQKTVHRPWGNYTSLEHNVGYQIKRIEVLPHSILSLQSHQHRDEHWIVVKGIATVTNDDRVFDLIANQSTFIAKTTKHRLENKTDELLVVIEVQYGPYLGEDDIVRYEDKYGRN